MNKESKKDKTIYVFVDASNLWEAQKAKGKLFDYEKLKNYLKEKFDAERVEIFYYSAYPAEGTRDYSLDGRHRFFYLFKERAWICCSEKRIKTDSCYYAGRSIH